jgi:hypothetical protein
LDDNNIEAVIPLRRERAVTLHKKRKSTRRHLVENLFCRLKAVRRIATRYEKTEKSFAAMINVVAVVRWTGEKVEVSALLLPKKKTRRSAPAFVSETREISSFAIHRYIVEGTPKRDSELAQKFLR